MYVRAPTEVKVIVTCPSCGARNRIDESRASAMQPKCGKCGTALPASAGHSEPLEVTDDTLSRVLDEAGDRPVLVDCWAAWCGPCRMIAPTIDALAAESAGRWIIAKLDTDRNQRTAAQFQIDSIPALLIFKRGQLVDRLVGVQPKPIIVQRLASFA